MTPAENITRAFKGDWHGNYGTIPTPGHSARDRGTTVRDGESGDVIFASFNGGDWRGIKDECRRRGLLPDRERQERARDIAAWDYTDADGIVLYRKVRMALPGGGKSYRFEHPDGRGGWAKKRGDARPVPYRLHELAHAPADVILYMAEGEKQADKLASWGLLATSSKDWRSFDYSGYVKGRTVVILPDNDEEGARIAETAREAVGRADGRAIVVELPGLPAKGDVMDWTGDAAALAALVDQALAGDKPAAALLPLADLTLWSATSATPTAFTVPGFIPKGEVTLATGTGGGNKSTFGQQLCTCSAAGVPILGLEVAQGTALYITAEDSPDRLHWMQEHICRAVGVEMAALAGKLHLSSIRGRLNNELATFDHDGRMQVRETFHLIRATVEATGASLLVLDNVAHLFAGNENDRVQVTAFVNLLYQLCRDLGVTVLLIAHKNKAGDSYSGSTAWLNAVRSQLVLEKPEGHDPDARVLTVGKANYARPDQTLAFRWHDFALVRDEDLPADKRAEIAKAIETSAANEAFLACLRERVRQGEGRGVGPSSGPNYAPSQFAGMAEAKGFRKDELGAAMDRLFKLGRIETYEHKVVGKGRSVTLIREVPNTPERTPERVPNTGPEHPRTVPPNTPPHTPYTTYTGGAAHEAAPPPNREEEKPDLSRVIFPADEPAKGPRGETLAPGEQPAPGWL